MNRLTQALADICRDRVLDEKWLIAPSLRTGHQWLDAVTRSGQPVLNVRTITLRALALDLAGLEIACKERRLVSARGASLIIDRILNRLKQQSPAYVTKLTITPSLSQTVYSSINDLRLAGLTADTLDRQTFHPSEKGAEIALIFEEYLKDLHAMGLVDYAEAIDIALRRLGVSPSPLSADVLVLVPDDLDLTGKERELVRAFPESRCITLPVDRPDTLPETCSTPTAADLLRWVLNPAHAPRPTDTASADDTVSIFRAVGEINEVREVFRRCIERGLPFDQVELIHTDASTYVPLVFETAARLAPGYSGVDDLFATFEEGIAASYARPGKALAAWVSWVRDGYLQSVLLKMLQEGIVRPPDSALGRVHQSTPARELRSIGIGFGRDRYLAQLDAAIQALERRQTDRPTGRGDDETPGRDVSEGLKERIEGVRCLRDLVERLLDSAPGTDAQPADVLRCAGRFLEEYSTRIGELDNYALVALLRAINEMIRYVGDQSDPVSLNVWDWLSSLPEETRVLGSGPRPGRLHVSSIHAGGHSLRKHTFVMGLDDSRFPGAGLQDPVILDSERSKLSAALPTASGRLERKLLKFAGLLARLRGTVTLSYSSRELFDDREMFPSQVVLSAFRIVSGRQESDYTALVESLGESASFAPTAPEKCLDITEWWMSGLCNSEGPKDPDAVLAGHFPNLSRGRAMAAQRSGRDFTTYDGKILRPGADLDPTSGSGRVMSQSSLETLGRCPRAYFFQYVLELEPPEDIRADTGRWLDQLQFGTLFHDFLYAFVSSAMKQRWPPLYPDDLADLESLAKSMAHELRDAIPAPTEQAFLRQVDELLAIAKVFLLEEQSLTDHRPLYCEASFGMRSYGDATALDTRQPVTLGLADGRTIRVRGRIDRIDSVGPPASNAYSICDYKSGSAFKYEGPDPFKQGRVVQHAIYSAAAEAGLREALSADATVREFTYFFPGVRERGLRLTYEPRHLSEWRRIVQALCDISASGSFLATNDCEKDCKYCDFREICKDLAGVAAASRIKLDNVNNVALKHMKELRTP